MQTHMKKILMGVAAAALFGASALPALAAGNIDAYMNNPGRIQAGVVGAQCGSGASSGSFGYFGKDYNMGIKTDPANPGANGYKTGLNNSGVCGNR